MLMNSDEQQGHDENVPSGVLDTDSVATFQFRRPLERVRRAH